RPAPGTDRGLDGGCVRGHDRGRRQEGRMNARRTRAMMVKEGRHILRDPRSLTMALAVPLMLLLLFGFALSLDVDHVPTMIYDADRSATSRELIRLFAGSHYFEIRGYAASY